MDLFKDLKDRGYIYQITDEEIKNKINNNKITIYSGFDPTGKSLHIGHLLPLTILSKLKKKGHKVIAVVGGATAYVGDPSGKDEARSLISPEEILKNSELISKQIENFLNKTEGEHIVVNNYNWLSQMNYLDFLRKIGRNFSVNKMLQTESVKRRIESQSGLSYLEFSYSLLQSFDFYKLNKEYNCTLQIGGQDQWGNIVAGIDLVRRLSQTEVYGFTIPLLLDCSGNKFGKTAKGAIWLSKELLSPYEYYQFWRNCQDDEVKNNLLRFTDIPIEEINKLSELQAPKINRSKEILAYETTKILHGKDKAIESYFASVNEFGESDPEKKIKTSSDIINIKKTNIEIPETIITQKDIDNNNINIIDLIIKTELLKSKSEVRRFIKQGGIYWKETRISDFNFKVNIKDMSEKNSILKVGKKNRKKITFNKN